jgi:uncharacterized damage-inducible protein DinB
MSKARKRRRFVPSDLVEAWNMSNEANLYFLKSVPAGCLSDRYSARTRTVAAQFAHMHNVRLRWLNHAAPKLVGKMKPFPKGSEPGKTELRRALVDSAKVVARFLEESDAAGKVKRWKGSPATFLGYLVAHEAHHRGLAMVAMRMSGRKLAQELVYGQWQWGKQRNTR